MIRPSFRAVCLLLLAITTVVRAAISGFYVDNGVDQTVMQRRLTPFDAEYVGHILLDILDLPGRPNRRNRKLNSIRMSATQYLLDVFKRLNDPEKATAAGVVIHRLAERSPELAPNDSNEIPPADTDRQIRTSDWIITFVNKKHHVAELHHDRGTELWFDVSEIPNDAHLILGVLRIFQDPKLAKWKKGVRKYVISVFTISYIKGDQLLQPLSTTNTTSDYRGWLELNITSAFDIWLNASSTNLGLYIDAHSVHRSDYKVKLSDIGLVKAHGDKEYQPFMVGYFREPKTIGRHQRTRRDTSHTRRRPLYEYDEYTELYNELLDHRKPADKKKSCQLSSLFVSFKDLQWTDWIVAPNGYGASFCGGECDFPLSFKMNATNHAIVQMLAHLVNPEAVPKPVCAPTKLSAISVLYFSEGSNINLKTFPDMTVDVCGCH